MRLPEISTADPNQKATTSRQFHSAGAPLQEVNEQDYGSSFRFYAITALLCVMVPFLLFASWRIIRSWGWWRITATGRGNESRGGLSYTHKQYIRTWHGWVDQSKVQDRREKKERKLQRNSKLRQCIGSASNDWVGLPQVRPLRPSRPPSPPTDFGALLQRTRGFSHGTTAKEAKDSKRRRERAQLLEEAMKSATAANDGSLDITRSTAIQEQDRVDLTTLRRIAPSQQSKEFMKPPRHNIRRPSLANVFPEEETIKTETFREKASMPGKAAPDQLPKIGIDLRVVGRSSSNYKKRNKCQPRRSNMGPKSTIPLLNPVTTMYRRHGKRRPTPSQGPEAPTNSQVITKAFCLGIDSFEQKSLDSRYIRGHGQERLEFNQNSTFLDSLHRRLEFWESPMFVDCFVQKPRNQTGILGRRSSPAMSWCKLPDISPSIGATADLNSEKSRTSKGSNQSSESAIFMKSFNAPQSIAKTSIVSGQSNSKISQLDGADSREASESPEPNLNGQGKIQFLEPSRPKKVKHPHRPGFQRTRSHALGSANFGVLRAPIRPLHNTLSRSVSLPMVPRINSSAASSAEMIDYEDLPTSEKAFFHDLYRKLHWLQFELSAGFREPDENTADMLFNVHGGAKNPNSRVPESVKKRALAGDPSPRSRSHTLEEKLRIPVPKVELWRIDVNRSRRNQQPSTIVELPKKPLRRPVSFEAIDVDDGQIDTAAWIIRRPPGGIPRSVEEAKPVRHEKRQLTIRRHNDWEKVRRPAMIKLAKRRIGRRELVQGKWEGAMLHMSLRQGLQRRQMHLRESMISASEDTVPSLKKEEHPYTVRRRLRSSSGASYRTNKIKRRPRAAGSLRDFQLNTIDDESNSSSQNTFGSSKAKSNEKYGGKTTVTDCLNDSSIGHR